MNETPLLTCSYEYSSFFGQAVSQNSSKPLIVKGFYLLRMSVEYCFRRAVQGKLSQWNRRNTATFLREVIVSQSSKRNKSICRWVFWKKSQKFFKICGEEPVLRPFIVKLQPVMAHIRFFGQLY